MTTTTTLTAPDMDEVRRRAWDYLMMISNNGATKITDGDVERQPDSGPMWDCRPLTRIANAYINDRSNNDRLVVGIRLKGKTPTQRQVRAVVNIVLAKWRKGWRAEWM